MSSFDLYDFNGSIKRNRTQEAMLNTLNSRAAFLEKLELERRERAEGGKKIKASLRIQSLWRGYCIRMKSKNELRRLFDSFPNDSIETQIRRISYFYNNDIDKERLTTVCSSVLRANSNVSTLPLSLRKYFAKRALFPFLCKVDGCMNVTAILRFIQITTKSNEWIIFVKNGYFDAILSVFIIRASSLNTVNEEERLAPHLKSIFDILLLPLEDTSTRCECTFFLLDSLTHISHNHLSIIGLTLCPSIVSYFSTRINLLVSSLDRDMNGYNSLSSPSIIPFLILLSSLLNLPLDQLSIHQSLLNHLSHLCPSIDYYSTVPPLLRNLIDNRLSSSSLISLYSSLPFSSQLVSTITYFSSISSFHRDSLYQLVLDPLFLPSYFSYLCSLSPSSNSLSPSQTINLLRNGILPSNSNQRHFFISSLALFSRLLNYLILRTDDDKFMESSWNFVFNYADTTGILSLLRDIALSLVSIVFPDEKLTGIEERKEIAKECEELFQEVVSLLQRAHSKDQRIEFLPRDFWSKHGKEISLSRRTLKSRRIERSNGRRGRGYSGMNHQPSFLQQFIETLSGSESDSDDEIERVERVARMNPSDRRTMTIMRCIPFVIPFIHRVGMLKELIVEDKESQRTQIDVSVRRTHLYEDAFVDLSLENARSLRPPLRVSMKNWIGMEEAGIDGGGIFREFLTEVIKEALDVSRGLFTETNDHLLYPNPLAPLIMDNYRVHYFFIGRLLGKAIYEGQLLDVRLADFFLSRLFSNNKIDVDLVQMKGVDPIVYNNLVQLRLMDTSKVESLDLDFSVLVDEMGRTRKVDLIPNGSNIRVNGTNRDEYIQKYVNFFLHERLSEMVECLRNGVSDVVETRWLAIFSARELALLVSGEEGDIDIDDLKRNTVIHLPRSSDEDSISRYIDSFWSVIRSFSSSERRLFIKFVTGCPRPPLGGFSTLHPSIGIQLVSSSDRLPSSATCMNLLKLPLYSDKSILEDRLRYSINAGAGFELS